MPQEACMLFLNPNYVYIWYTALTHYPLCPLHFIINLNEVAIIARILIGKRLINVRWFNLWLADTRADGGIDFLFHE